jgi:hypothetical protein
LEAAIEAFGPLRVDGQVALTDQLIGARAQYVAHRISVWDKAGGEGVRLKRLKEFCSLAVKMRRLFYRDGTEFCTSNIDPAFDFALPDLCRIGSERGSSQIWDHNFTLLRAALADLSKLGDRARERQFRKTHGGKRREGRSPKNDLIARLIDIYADLRRQNPDSGPAVAFNAQLKRFVRAGLAFTVSLPAAYTDTDGKPFLPHPASFLEADLHLPKRTSDRVIEGVFNRSPHFKT